MNESEKRALWCMNRITLIHIFCLVLDVLHTVYIPVHYKVEGTTLLGFRDCMGTWTFYQLPGLTTFSTFKNGFSLVVMATKYPNCSPRFTFM